MATMGVICQYGSPRGGSLATYHPIVAAHVTSVVLICRGCNGVSFISAAAHGGSKVHGALCQEIEI